MPATSNHQRVIRELCELIGFGDYDHLLNGGKLRIDGHTISFFDGSDSDTESILVYIDMGMPVDDVVETYMTMLKINFLLEGGQRGTMSLHPQTHHVFYAFRFEVDDAALGRTLLDVLMRFIGEVGVEALRLREHEEIVDVLQLHRAEKFRGKRG